MEEEDDPVRLRAVWGGGDVSKPVKPMTPGEARNALVRFNSSHWSLPGDERARYSIPADPERDDDLRLADFIDRAEALAQAARAFLDTYPVDPDDVYEVRYELEQALAFALPEEVGT